MAMDRGKYAGWSVRGRPFSPAQFNKSHIKSSHRLSYSAYLKFYARRYARRYKI